MPGSGGWGTNNKNSRLAWCTDDYTRCSLRADLDRIAADEYHLAWEKDLAQLEAANRREIAQRRAARRVVAAERIIGLVVRRADGRPETRVEVRTVDPVLGSLEAALEQSGRERVAEAWVGELQLDGDDSWDSQGVVAGATVRLVFDRPVRRLLDCWTVGCRRRCAMVL